jgi:putative peptidoglycan lipid II flippase
VDEAPAARGRRLAWSTAIFALATGLSRILGLVREIVAAYYFGVAGKINAFTVAFQVPNLVRSLVADAALSSAFVPVFSELLERGDRKRAWRVASSLFWLMLLGLGALSALLIVLAPLVIAPFGNPGGDKQLAIGLSRVLFPIVALLGVSGVIVGILNSYEHFTVPALSPVFWNIAIILGLVLGVPNADSVNAQLYVYAISILIGTVIQVLLPVPWLRGLDGRLHFVLDWRDPAVRRVFVLMVPVTIGLGLINFNLVIDSIFASRLIDPELAPTAIDKALHLRSPRMFSVPSRPCCSALRARRPAATSWVPAHRRPRPAPDRVPARARERVLGRWRSRSSACSTSGATSRRSNPRGRRSAGRLRRRSYLQRHDADAEPAPSAPVA